MTTPQIARHSTIGILAMQRSPLNLAEYSERRPFQHKLVEADLPIAFPRNREWMLTLHCGSAGRQNRLRQLNDGFGEINPSQ
ncbi:MAG: hypothetical protein NT159_24730 [Proteobacteria bacterium]|nr:hypothetical protein [Pseudomonadota bacterium]